MNGPETVSVYEKAFWLTLLSGLHSHEEYF